jgi:hypothetical protein
MCPLFSILGDNFYVFKVDQSNKVMVCVMDKPTMDCIPVVRETYAIGMCKARAVYTFAESTGVVLIVLWDASLPMELWCLAEREQPIALLHGPNCSTVYLCHIMAEWMEWMPRCPFDSVPY